MEILEIMEIMEIMKITEFRRIFLELLKMAI
jgi:hypothetical protein